jgi:L-ectoine synthase
VEAVWLVEGEGTLTDLDNGVTYELTPGSMYLLDGHERHRLEVRTTMRMMCVFNPPVTGQEVHDSNGVYPLVAATIGG